MKCYPIICGLFHISQYKCPKAHVMLTLQTQRLAIKKWNHSSWVRPLQDINDALSISKECFLMVVQDRCRSVKTQPWASTTIKIMVDPISMTKTLTVSNGGYINTHCFNGGWNPRVQSWSFHRDRCFFFELPSFKLTWISWISDIPWQSESSPGVLISNMFFMFTPICEEMIQSDEFPMFQIRWFSHQLEKIVRWIVAFEKLEKHMRNGWRWLEITMSIHLKLVGFKVPNGGSFTWYLRIIYGSSSNLVGWVIGKRPLGFGPMFYWWP